MYSLIDKTKEPYLTTGFLDLIPGIGLGTFYYRNTYQLTHITSSELEQQDPLWSFKLLFLGAYHCCSLYLVDMASKEIISNAMRDLLFS